MKLSYNFSPEQIMPVVTARIAPRHWDFVFTCFEPLVHVTGGIGTYHRLLLEELAASGKSILVLTRAVNSDVALPENVTVITIDGMTPPKPFNFVGSEHEQFSLGCHFAFRDLYRKGHRFGFVEFSDYGGDGFYPLRARASGLYEFGTAAVRLHSPHLMLVIDNGGDFANLTNFRRDQIDRELGVYEDADIVLYGGDAMAERVSSLCAEFGVDIRSKLVKCPHPYPKHLFRNVQAAGTGESSQKAVEDIILASNPAASGNLQGAVLVGLFGRIEDRKGQYQFFWALLKNREAVDYLVERNVHFVIAGHSVLDASGNYKLADIKALIAEKGLASRFHFLGRVPQDTLAVLSERMAGFVFPSVFENYPNALLEVLPSCKPVAISAHGCMPEITEGFSSVTVFDPTKLSIGKILEFMNSLGRELPPDELGKRIGVLEERQHLMRAFYLKEVTPGPRAAARHGLTLGVVIPVFEDHRFLADAIRSCKECLEPGDRIVVVDDGSSSQAAEKIRSITGSEGVELLEMGVNAGPAAARRRGVEHLQVDLIQFCDADDLLEPSGIGLSRQVFAADEGLTLVSGIMSCFQDANHCWVPRNGHIWNATEQNFAHAGSMFRRGPLLEALSVPHAPLPMNEDWFLNLLILAKGGVCKMLPEITYYYRRFQGTRSTLNTQIEADVNRKLVRMAWRHIDFTVPQLRTRLRFMPYGDSANFALTVRRLKKSRRNPYKLLLDLWTFKVLRVIAPLAGLFSKDVSVQLWQAVAKRDPNR